jgi:rhodanese-related sulfurtransferase
MLAGAEAGAGPAAILDVRSEALFAAGHAPGAANIPLEELARRSHELPPKGSGILLYDADPDRLRRAADALRQRGYAVHEGLPAQADLRESGPSRVRLWQPSPFLVEALEHIRPPDADAPPGRALDVACGAGREAVYLALSGYEVEAVDVLPDALERAADLARRSGVRLTVTRQNLRRDTELPAQRYGLVTVFRFVHRLLLPAVGQSVAPGGYLVYEAFNWWDAAAGRKPLKPGHTLRDGELAAAFAGFEVLIARDGVERGGRTFSQLLARRNS